jgi:predicted alpha/beta-hydrolase family hydrolase
MTIEPEKITVSVDERASVTALLYAAAKNKKVGTTIVLGHGAGGNQLSGFMRLFAGGLAARGLDTMTFNFLYSERGRGGPDHKTKLEACYAAVIDTVRRQRKLKANRLVIGGKSMGGRIASQVAATGAHELTGLVFLGYPLHPPGKPEQLRDAHLKDIQAPMLFMQGSRDAFGTPDELREVITRLKLPASLYEVATGDHSFKVLKSAPLPQPQVYEAAMDEIVNWLSALR